MFAEFLPSVYTLLYTTHMDFIQRFDIYLSRLNQQTFDQSIGPPGNHIHELGKSTDFDFKHTCVSDSQLCS